METSINNTMLLSPDSQKVNAFKQFNLIFLKLSLAQVQNKHSQVACE